MDTNTTIKWMPAIPLPAPPFDVQKRIQELRGYMDPNNPWYQPQGQHTNIKAAIKLYEDGKIDGVEEVFIMDGKVVPEKEIWTGKTWSWSEGRHHHQFGQRTSDCPELGEVKSAQNELLSHLALDSHTLNQHPFQAEILCAMDTNTNTNTTIKWMPVYQPPPFDVQKRIEQLHGYLDPDNPCYERKEQHTNIKAVIKLYEDGKIDGVHEVCIMDGKIVPRKEIYTGKAWGWLEGIRHQFALKQTYGHGPFGVNAHEVSKKKVFAFQIPNIYNSFFRFECC